jgi:CheY-like chemotaxis protein
VIRVLVVDDDVRVRDTYVDMLRAGGYEVQSAADGAAALRVFSEWKPDVVLVDMFMPVMDGLDVIGALRRLTPDVGIIAMSGMWQRAIMDRALSLGASETLLKPIDMDTLFKTVDAIAGESS